MARDASGTHSLPAGQPVVDGTTISASAHNALVSDLSAEITDSLSRSGKGSMTAPLKAAVGSVSAPGYTFDGDANSGVHWIGPDNIGAVVGGALVQEWSASQSRTYQAHRVPNGTVGAPSMGFALDTDCGVYLPAPDEVAVAVAGTQSQRWTTTKSALATNLELEGADPATATGFANTVTPKNIVKAWARIQTDGIGGVSIVDGFNAASVSLPSGDRVDLVMGTGIATAASSGATVTDLRTPPITTANLYTSILTSTTTVRISGLAVTTTPTAAAIDFSGAVQNFLVVVYGAQ